MGVFIYIIGLVAAIWCVLDIFRASKIDAIMKVVLAVLVLATSWLGFALYYIILRDRIQ